MIKIMLILISFISIGRATIIYADSALASNCTSGNYSIANHNCTGSDGNAYTTVQAALNAMSGGDTLYIRAGTYEENVLIPDNGSKDGTSSNWTLIASYPREWAILDGGHNEYYTLGHHDTGSLGTNDISYIWVSRLEITGGGQTDRGGGFCGNGGPFKIHYVYFHDNIVESSSENPGAIRGYCWRDSEVKYCVFENNGSSQDGDNGGDIVIFADYRYTTDPHVNFNTGNYEGYYNARNEYAYNLFVSGVNGIRQKSQQDMCDEVFTLPNQYEAWGDKIHHNIFLDYSFSSIQVWQDFCQVYNNITIGDEVSDKGSIQVRSASSGTADVTAHVTIYNNTLKYSDFRFHSGGSNNTWTSYIHMYNNIIDYYYGNYKYRSVNIGVSSRGPEETNITLMNAHFGENYLYRPQRDGWNVGSLITTYRSTSSFDTEYSTSNYEKASSKGSDNLFMGSGNDSLIARGVHIVSGEITIADGGNGEAHPYLNGVVLPSYIGATDPNDNKWVNEVLNLKNIFTSAPSPPKVHERLLPVEG